jgi:hypothetical protein
MANDNTPGAIATFIPIPAIAELNRKGEHWTKAKERHDLQKRRTWIALRCLELDEQAAIRAISHPVVVLTVVSLKKLDDDNLVGAVKYYRDEVARFLDIDDGDERIQFVVKQKRPGKGEIPGVWVEFQGLISHIEAMIAELRARLAKLKGDAA